MGGNFNFCLDPILDKSATSTSKSKSASTTPSLRKDFNLIDVWTQIHPQTIDYCFYSNCHKSHTRKNIFLLSTHVSYRALESDYLPRILSDHSPLGL